jgi:hypothetical protein
LGLKIGEDVSDSLFTIRADTIVVVDSPNGGEVLVFADSHLIQWTAPAHTDTVVISFSADSAFSWQEIVSGEPNNGFYIWTVPAVATDSALIKVEAYDLGLKIGEDVSDSLFTIWDGIGDVPGDRPGLGPTAILWQNSPNPLTSATSISFYLPKDEVVYLRVFDAKGRLVDVLMDGIRRETGVHTIPWDGVGRNGSRLSSGVYFYRLSAGGFVQTKKMVLAQ